MKKYFKSRFMPNVKFKIKGDITKCSDFFNTKMLQDGLFYAITDMNGCKIFHIPDVCFDSCIYKEVSIYEAIPELVPNGMRYDKESDSLIPVSNAEFIKSINKNHRSYNVGSSNYASMKIQPWDVWKDWDLNPWDADIVKRISRTKEIPGKSFAEARIEDYEKIKHICDERISQLKKLNDK